MLKRFKERFDSKRYQLRKWFTTHPGVWIGYVLVAEIGGKGGYRARITELRQDSEWPLNIVNRGSGEQSEYKLAPRNYVLQDGETNGDDR